MKSAYSKHLTALLLFGTNGIVASQIHLDSYEIVLFRTLIGSILLFALFLGSKRHYTFWAHKKDFCFIAISGVAMGASWMLLYEAYVQIGVGIASLLYYTGPVIIMVLSPILFHEKLTATKLIGFAAVLAGIVLINGNILGGSGNLFGIACGLLSALTYSVMVVANKKSKHISGMENTSIQLFVSFLTVAVFVGCKSGFSMEIRPTDWLYILMLGVVNTGIGCYFYFSSIGALPVQTVAICGYLEPLSAVLFAALLLHETMLPLQILGAVLMVGGAIFGECMSHTPQRDVI